MISIKMKKHILLGMFLSGLVLGFQNLSLAQQSIKSTFSTEKEQSIWLATNITSLIEYGQELKQKMNKLTNDSDKDISKKDQDALKKDIQRLAKKILKLLKELEDKNPLVGKQLEETLVKDLDLQDTTLEKLAKNNDGGKTGGEETETPSGEGTGTPGEEETGTPSGEETGTSGGEETGTPGEEETGTPGGEETGTPGEEETGTPGGEETGTPGGEETVNSQNSDDKEKARDGEETSSNTGNSEKPKTDAPSDKTQPKNDPTINKLKKALDNAKAHIIVLRQEQEKVLGIVKNAQQLTSKLK
jgi:hypothetical protein